MSLSCDYNGDMDGCAWFFYPPCDEAPLITRYSRKCCSCGAKIMPGYIAREVPRCRPGTEWEQFKGIGDEIRIASWYLCETCGDLESAIADLGFCYTFGDESLKQQIAEYRAMERGE